MAINTSGSLVTWGSLGVIQAQNVVQVSVSESGWIGLTDTGTVLNYGSHTNGISLPVLQYIKVFAGGYGSYAALASTGSLVVWEYAVQNSPVVYTGFSSNASTIVIEFNYGAGIAVRTNGAAVTWGNTGYYTDLSTFLGCNVTAYASGFYYVNSTCSCLACNACPASTFIAVPCAGNGTNANGRTCASCTTSCPVGYVLSGTACSGAGAANTMSCTPCNGCLVGYFLSTPCPGGVGTDPNGMVCSACLTGCANCTAACGSGSISTYTSNYVLLAGANTLITTARVNNLFIGGSTNNPSNSNGLFVSYK